MRQLTDCIYECVKNTCAYACRYDMLFCMRTTLNIDDRLMKRVRTLAAERGQTLTQVVEQALWMAVQPEPREGRFQFNWVMVRGKPQPGIDLTDRDALYEKMEGRN